MVGLNFLGEYIAPLGTSGLSTINTIAGKIIRAYGTMPHPNLLSAFLILGLISGLFFVSHETGESIKRNYYRVLVLVGLFIISLGIFVTFSRLTWLTAVVAIGIFLCYFIWRKQKNLVVQILILIIISSATILFFYQDNLKARISDSDSVSVTDRYFFDRLGMELVGRNLITGVGVGNYVPALQENYQLEPWQHQPPHNIFIFIAAELGLVGLGIFLAFLWTIFKPLFDIRWDNLSISIATVGILFLFLSLFDHYFVTIQQGRLMFATILGLIAVLPHLNHERTN